MKKKNIFDLYLEKVLALPLWVKQVIYIKLKEDIRLKEESRHSSASKVGALQKNINCLEKELKLANDKIEFLKNNRKSPSLEELKAYEYSRREVLKRQNERKD